MKQKYPILTEILEADMTNPSSTPVLAFTIDDVQNSLREIQKANQKMEIALVKNAGKSQLNAHYAKELAEIKKRLELTALLLAKIFKISV